MKTTPLLLFVLLAACTGSNRPPDTPSFSADRIKAHTAFLADDVLEGRAAGTRGHEIAARYFASELAALGVKPGGTNGTYFQTVELLEAARSGPAPFVRLTSSRGTKGLPHGSAVMVMGPTAGGAVTVKGPLVFVGYGMKDAALRYDDYAGLDVRGKIVVVLFGSPKGIDSEVGAHLQSEQARVAAEHGGSHEWAKYSAPSRPFSSAVLATTRIYRRGR